MRHPVLLLATFLFFAGPFVWTFVSPSQVRLRRQEKTGLARFPLEMKR